MGFDREDLKELSRPQSWDKGLRYYQSDRVREVLLDGDKLIAEVSGNSYPFYEVELNIEDPYYHYCSCPYDWGGICKHIIAVGLTWLHSGEGITRADKKKAGIRERLEKLTEEMEREDFIDFLTDVSLKRQGIERELSDYVEEQGFNSADSRLKRLEILHQEALAIIEEFNHYGGGSELEADEFYESVHEMMNLLQEHDFPARQRQEIIEDFVDQHLAGNCSLIDAALELAFTAAETEVDWHRVIDLLQQSDDSYHQERIIQIYREELEDEERYLELRQQHLNTGHDYYDLVKFYDEKGEIGKAVETAQKGIEAGGWGVGQNISYLRDHYIENGDYERGLKFYLQEFRNSPTSEKFFQVLDYCRSEDIEEIENRMIEHLKERNSYTVLADIYDEREEYEKVLHLVKEKDIAPAEEDEILDEKFPREMIKIYKDNVQNHIDAKKRKSYRRGAEIALKIKNIYCQQLNERGKWDSYIQGILEEYPRHPALQEEFREICLE
ncbi:SWIM zinc finger family protein [Halarsenatibacter silvermanii]|nr:hypothetical protein [Halarsenatibacter silvermanii]